MAVAGCTVRALARLARGSAARTAASSLSLTASRARGSQGRCRFSSTSPTNTTSEDTTTSIPDAKGRAENVLPANLRQLVRFHSASVPQEGKQKERVHGWVRSVRAHRKVTFLGLSDGTLPADEVLQAVVPSDLVAAHSGGLTPGTAVRLVGDLVPSRGSGQAIELKVDSLEVIGQCDATTHPLAVPQQLTPETLRRLAHLRPRAQRFAAVLRSRHALLRGMEKWFDDRDFLRITTPIITASDCEGAGEVFQVVADADVPRIEAGQASVEGEKDQSTGTSKSLSAFFSNTPAYLTVSSQLHLEAVTALAHPRTYTIAPAFRAEGSATSRHLSEFWMCEAEVAFIDTDDTDDPSVALEQTMWVCEQAVKAALRTALGTEEADRAAKERRRDAEWLHGSTSNPTSATTTDVPANDETELASLRHIASPDRAPWPRITYTHAIELLQEQHRSVQGGAFTIEPIWGHGLASEHERWLASEAGPWKDRDDASKTSRGGGGGGGPVFVTDFPAGIKAFYMRANTASTSTTATPTGSSKGPNEGQTVACFDLLVPRIGELAGGSVREEREDVLERRMRELGLAHDPAATADDQLDVLESSEQQTGRNFDWYAKDLRRYGGAPHGGFGIGIERLVSWATGTESVRDCIPFPRTTGAVRF